MPIPNNQVFDVEKFRNAVQKIIPNDVTKKCKSVVSSKARLFLQKVFAHPERSFINPSFGSWLSRVVDPIALSALLAHDGHAVSRRAF